jgi:hypothetical protein
MSRMLRMLVIGFVVVCCYIRLGETAAAAAAEGANTILARLGQTSPDGLGTLFDFYKISLNDRGQVAFYTSMYDVPPGQGAAILTGDALGLNVVVRQGQAVSGNPSLLLQVDANFSSNTLLLNNRGDLAFSLSHSLGTFAGRPIDNGVFLARRGRGEDLIRIPQSTSGGEQLPHPLFPLALTAGGQLVVATALDESLILPPWTYGVGALYRSTGGPLLEIARTGQPVPGSDTLLAPSIWGAKRFEIFDNDSFAFVAKELDPRTGSPSGASIFSFNSSGLQRLGPAAPDAPFDVNDTGQAVFARGGVVVVDETGRRDIAQIGDIAPDRGTFSVFSRGTINNRGDVLFQAETLPVPDPFYPDQGVFLATDAGIHVIARTGDVAPSGFGRFSLFENAVLTEWGAVFIAVLDVPGSDYYTYGLYAWDGKQIHEVIRRGAELSGGTVAYHSGAFYEPDFAVNGNGQIAYRAKLESGHNLLVLWTPPVPEPSHAALLIECLLLAFTWRIRYERSEVSR